MSRTKNYFLYLIIIVFLFAGLTSCKNIQNITSKTENSTFQNKATPINELKFGVCQGGLTNSSEEYQLMDILGADYIRNSISWSSVEKSPGKWDFSYYDKFMNTAAKYHKKVIIVLAYDTGWIYKKGDKNRNITKDKLPFYLNYVKKIASKYGKQAYGFEIWNEPNTPMFWKGSDKDFLELTHQTALLLKSILPNKPVAVGSIFYHPLMGGRSYLKKIILSGILDYTDAVSLHPYGLSITASAKRVAEADRIIKEAGYDKEIWVTEIGFTTNGWYPNKTTVKGQAKSVIESIVRLTAAGADLITWFKLLDGQMPDEVKKNTSSEEFFGLAYPNYSLKPSGKSYSLLVTNIQGSGYIQDGVQIESSFRNRIESFRFDKVGGNTALILWLKSRKQDTAIRIAGFTGKMKSINLISGESYSLKNDFDLRITHDPILILLNTAGNPGVNPHHKTRLLILQR